MTEAELQKLYAQLQAAAERQRFQHKLFFHPYPKQWEFIALGATRRERLLMAGNQVGKSEVGAFEMACHLTGQYPPEFVGRKFDRPVRAWAVGETSILVRDVQQKKLCGEPGVADALGTGMIPKDCFVDKPSLARGVTDAYDTIQVQHYTNGVKDGISILKFKSYEQGREKMQGDTIDIAWCDEEPPEDIYSEIITRTNAVEDAIIFITFTPLKGMSGVVLRFVNEPNHPDRGMVIMTIDDAAHMSEERKKQIIASYRPHEREARTKGIPMLGSGRIFTAMESSIGETALSEIPAHWWKLWSVDFGIDHPFAAVLAAWDKDADIWHIIHAIRESDQLPLQHAAAMKAVAANVPVAWPHDGNTRDRGTGEGLAPLYRAQGLHMLAKHATFIDGSISTEAGVMEMQDRMDTGRFKVAKHLEKWWEEYRMYHRKDGQIVKLRDDLMSATRIGLMGKRYAQQVPLGNRSKRRTQQVADGIDFDLD